MGPAQRGTQISFRGLCQRCSVKAQRVAIGGMLAGVGEHHERWAQSLIKAYHRAQTKGAVPSRLEGIARSLREQGYDV